MEDETQLTEIVGAALARTRAAGSARIELSTGARALPPMPRPGGLVSRVMMSFPRWVVTAGAAAENAEGVVDFHKRRYMIDFGAYAQLYADGRQWGGASGRSLSSLSANKSLRATPWWLMDLLDGVQASCEADRQDVRGATCRRFTADVDPDHLRTVLPASWLDDPAGLQLETWIDEYVRRVRVRAEQRTQTLELWDVATHVDDLDWDRLPVFRSSE